MEIKYTNIDNQSVEEERKEIKVMSIEDLLAKKERLEKAIENCDAKHSEELLYLQEKIAKVEEALKTVDIETYLAEKNPVEVIKEIEKETIEKINQIGE